MNVFVSYSHDNEDHMNWVIKLSTHLRSHGVNIILDQWDLRLGDDLPFFMEQGLSASHLVLCICSETYVKKSNGMNGGVGFEKMILSSYMLKQSDINYIIPVIRNNNTDEKVPKYLSSKLYIDFSNDAQFYSKYQELIERIFNQDIAKKPPLGDNPFSNHLAQSIIAQNELDKINYHSPALVGKVVFRCDRNSHIYNLGTGDYFFKTYWSAASNDEAIVISDYVKIIGYKDGCSEIPTISQISEFDYSSRSRYISKSEIIVWINNLGKILVTKLINVKSKSHGAISDEVEFEYKIINDELIQA